MPVVFLVVCLLVCWLCSVFWGVVGVCRWMHDFLFMFFGFGFCLVGAWNCFLFCFFWLGLGFSRPGFDLFVESLILAQDERWRRA